MKPSWKNKPRIERRTGGLSIGNNLAGIIAGLVLLGSGLVETGSAQVFDDAVFRVTFDGESTDDVTSGNVSTAEVETEITFTEELPEMPNSTGNAALFNGETSFLSYGLGAVSELQIESALTYHARVRLNADQFETGEQWVMGRFRSVDQGNNTRISVLSSFAGPRHFFGGVSEDGSGWFGGLQNSDPPEPDTFYDLFLRFAPEDRIWFDVFNAETGERLGQQNVVPAIDLASLMNANSPFDVGNRTTPQNVPLSGAIEQINVWNRALSNDEVTAIATDSGFLALNLIQNLQPEDGSLFLPADTAIEFSAVSEIGVNPDGIQLTLNGVDRTGELNVTGDANQRQIAFDQLEANTFYQAEISVTDLDGNTKTQSIRFNTLSEGIRFVEAEDYNFESGQFIDDPELSSTPGPNNYLDRFGTEGIDYHMLESDDNPYRIGDGVRVIFSDDPLREHFLEAQAQDPGVDDYAVSRLQGGEWLNYTRTFSEGAYRLYARLANGSAGPFSVRVDRVTAGATTENQTLSPAGVFQAAEGTGGWQSYELVQLTGVFGGAAALNLQGTETVRMTAVQGQVNVNYLLFVPVGDNAADFGPIVTAVSPADGSRGVPVDSPIQFSLVDGATVVAEDSVRLTVNGETAEADVTRSGSTTTVSYEPSEGLPESALVTAELEFSDDASPANVQTHSISFLTERLPIDLPPLQQDPNGFVVIETENFDANIPGSERHWGFGTLGFMEGFTSGFGPNMDEEIAVEELEQFSGEGFMGSSNQEGLWIEEEEFLNNSPELQYQIHLDRTGTHYVWIRELFPTGFDDSIIIALDGQPPYIRITGPSPSWIWSNQTQSPSSGLPTFEVANPGEHTLHVWMREDGAFIDKIILTTDESFTPGEGVSLEESARVGDAPPPSVSLDSPSAGQIFDRGADVSLSATASDEDGEIVRVEFFAGDEQIGEAPESPYAFTWTGAPQGEHVLRAEAVDDEGNRGRSGSVQIVVGPPSGETPEIFADAIFRVTFAGDSTSDITADNVSNPVVDTDITFTEELPPMANASGTAALFNGDTSFLSYGLGAADELKIESALSYHARVKFDAENFEEGEQWIMGRFRSPDQGTDTRVSVLSSFAGPRRIFGGASGNGNAWAGDLQFSSTPQPDVYYDVFLRFDPGVSVRFDVFNAQTGGRLGEARVVESEVPDSLRDANSPFDVGNRTTPQNVPLSGAIEQMNVWARPLSDLEIQAITKGPDAMAPEVEILRIGLTQDNLIQLVIQSSAPPENHAVQQATDVASAEWSDVSEVSLSSEDNGTVRAQFPVPAESPRFYRVVLE